MLQQTTETTIETEQIVALDGLWCNNIGLARRTRHGRYDNATGEGDCFIKGLIVRPLVNLNVMLPLLIMSKDDVDFVVAVLRDAILETTEELKAEGHF